MSMLKLKLPDVAAGDPLSTVLELAGGNDVAGLRHALAMDPAAADEPGIWYGRNGIVRRTPLMVAATYGNLDTMRFLLAIPSVDVNRHADVDGATALHCAAYGASSSAAEATVLLLQAGADPEAADFAGLRPADVIAVPPAHFSIRFVLQSLLARPQQDSIYTPAAPTSPEKKENAIYASDEFRMYTFKVKPCSRANSHDWTECPFAHPGENARRRDPRKYHYCCLPCPDHRKDAACPRGDLCNFAHGVFECWLHPAQYRTRLCKDADTCTRRVCFFAHNADELRPLYVPSPRFDAAASMEEMAMAMLDSPPSPFAMKWPPHQELDHLCLRRTPSRRNSLNRADLEDLLLAEIAASNSDAGGSFSPQPATCLAQLIQQQQSPRLSPIITRAPFSPRSMDAHRQASVLGMPSPRRMSSSPVSSPHLADHERHAQMRRRSLQLEEYLDGHRTPRVPCSTHVGSPWSSRGGGSTLGTPDWAINGEELEQLQRGGGNMSPAAYASPRSSSVMNLRSTAAVERLLEQMRLGEEEMPSPRQ